MILPDVNVLDLDALDLSTVAAGEFLGEVGRVIDVPERFEDGGGIDGGGAPLLVGVGIIPGKALQVAVENDADEFAGAVNHRTAGVASDDVVGADEIQRGF